MNDKNNEAVFDFFVAITRVFLALPFGTFTILKKSHFKRTKLKAAFILLAVGTSVYLVRHFLMPGFDLGVRKKWFLMGATLIYLNLTLTAVLLFTEKWWKEIDYIKDEILEEAPL